MNEKKLGFQYIIRMNALKHVKSDRIVTLGGSTTTPHFAECWPKQLYRTLKAEGLNAKIYNGGWWVYEAQELLSWSAMCYR